MKITRLLVAASSALILTGASPSLLAQETPPAAAIPTAEAPAVAIEFYTQVTPNQIALRIERPAAEPAAAG
jgi:hypothetical protein